MEPPQQEVEKASMERQFRESEAKLRDTRESLACKTRECDESQHKLQQMTKSQKELAARVSDLELALSTMETRYKAQESELHKATKNQQQLEAELGAAHSKLVNYDTRVRQLEDRLARSSNPSQNAPPVTIEAVRPSGASASIPPQPTTPAGGPQSKSAFEFFREVVPAAFDNPTDRSVPFAEKERRFGLLSAALVEFFCDIEGQVYATLDSISEQHPQLAEVPDQLRAFRGTPKIWLWCLTHPGKIKEDPVKKFNLYLDELRSVHRTLIKVYYGVLSTELMKKTIELASGDELEGEAVSRLARQLGDECIKMVAEKVIDGCRKQ